MMQSNYDKQPYVAVPNGAGACVTGWATIADQLSRVIAAGDARNHTSGECASKGSGTGNPFRPNASRDSVTRKRFPQNEVSSLVNKPEGGATRCVLVVECYTGVHVAEIAGALEALKPVAVIRSETAFLAPEVIDAQGRHFQRW